MEGYIKDHRQELISDIWQMPPLYHRLWQWLKYQVNHKDVEIPMNDGSKMAIKKGQHLTSVRKIAHGIGWYERGLWKEPNPKTVTEMLKWMEKQNMLTLDNGNSRYTLVTLINWDVFQKKEDESNAKVTVNGEVSIQSLGTNKNEKNEKNEKKLKHIEFFQKYTSNPELIKALMDFVEMRKEIKKPLSTERMINTLLGNLDKLSLDDKTRIEILDQAIFNKWQTVYALKSDFKSQRYERPLSKQEQSNDYLEQRMREVQDRDGNRSVSDPQSLPDRISQSISDYN